MSATALTSVPGQPAGLLATLLATGASAAPVTGKAGFPAENTGAADFEAMVRASGKAVEGQGGAGPIGDLPRQAVAAPAVGSGLPAAHGLDAGAPTVQGETPLGTGFPQSAVLVPTAPEGQQAPKRLQSQHERPLLAERAKRSGSAQPVANVPRSSDGQPGATVAPAVAAADERRRRGGAEPAERVAAADPLNTSISDGAAMPMAVALLAPVVPPMPAGDPSVPATGVATGAGGPANASSGQQSDAFSQTPPAAIPDEAGLVAEPALQASAERMRTAIGARTIAPEPLADTREQRRFRPAAGQSLDPQGFQAPAQDHRAQTDAQRHPVAAVATGIRTDAADGVASAPVAGLVTIAHRQVIREAASSRAPLAATPASALPGIEPAQSLPAALASSDGVAGAAAAPPTSYADMAAMVEAIETARAEAGQGGDGARVRIRHDSLGPMTLDFAARGETVELAMTTPDPEVASLLAAQAGAIERAGEPQGVRVETVALDQGQMRFGPGNDSDPRQGSQQGSQAGTGVAGDGADGRRRGHGHGPDTAIDDAAGSHAGRNAGGRGVYA